MPKFQSKPTSAARAKLQESLKAKIDLDAELVPLREQLAKLATQGDAVAPAETALARLDAAEDHHALLWARGEGPRPEPDVEGRDRLRRELDAARASAASAERAKLIVQADIDRVLARGPIADANGTSAVAEILVEELTPMLATLKADAVSLAARIGAFRYGANRAIDLAHAGADHEAVAAAGALMSEFKPDWRGVFDSVSVATDAFADVLHQQEIEVAKLRAFEDDVRGDPGVRIEGGERPITVAAPRARIEPPTRTAPQLLVGTSRMPIIQQLKSGVA